MPEVDINQYSFRTARGSLSFERQNLDQMISSLKVLDSAFTEGPAEHVSEVSIFETETGNEQLRNTLRSFDKLKGRKGEKDVLIGLSGISSEEKEKVF